MKKLFSVIVIMLALNFLALAGGVGYLFKNGQLDRAKVTAIKEILFPAPAAVAPATQPTTQPTLKLEELLAEYAGRPPVEQLEHIRQAFNSQMEELRREQREMLALRTQAELARKAAEQERASLEADKKKFKEQEATAEKLASDKGFQDSLALYTALPAKTTKTLMMGLDVETAVQYLQAMEPRAAARITKEFKSAEESDRLKQIMDRMRSPTTQTASTP